MDGQSDVQSGAVRGPLDRFVVAESATLRDALMQIECNQHGVVLVTNVRHEVVGLATDGDIRRGLLSGRALDDFVLTCANRDFRWVGVDTPHENLLKQLDQRIRSIPVLDAARRLQGLVTRDHLPVRAEARTYARARAPVRVSFGGGGSDLTHYFAQGQGAVINATISLYSHATLRVRDDSRVTVQSLDLGESTQADDLPAFLQQQGSFGLIQSLLKVLRPEFGFDLFVHSDFPVGSGLGGSASVSTAILGCFNMLRYDRWDNYEIAEIAFQAERLHLGVAGGWQDQYAAVFGGFNFMEFSMNQNVVHPLRVHPDVLLELEESLVLCDTGIAHKSGDIHRQQRKDMQDEDIKRQVRANVDLTYEIRNLLLRGRLAEFGQALHEAWSLKRQFSSVISNEQIDAIYEGARRNGATGGKLLGAGGGGFFIFYTPPFVKHQVVNYLSSRGLHIHPFRFEPAGLQGWSVREDKSCVRGVDS